MPDDNMNEQNSPTPEQPSDESIVRVVGAEHDVELTHTDANHSPVEVEPSTSTVAAQEASKPVTESATTIPAGSSNAPFNPAQPAMQTPQPPVPGGKKGISKKKAIIIAAIAAVLVLLFGGSALAYNVWYQNPQKVITDALVNAVSAKSVKATGTLSAVQDGGKNSVKIKFNGEGDQEQGTGTVDLDFNYEDKNLKLKGDAIYLESGDLYVKVDGIKKAVDSLLEGMELPQSYTSLISKIDDNWILISADKLKEVNKDAGDTQECVADVMKKLRSDKKAMNEIGDAYRNNQFVVIKDDLGSKDGSIGYVVDTDSKKGKEFGKALEKTQLYKELKKCDKANSFDDKDVEDITKSDDDSDTPRMELWVSTWSHEFTKISINGTSDGTKVDFVLSPEFNVPVKVNKPSKSMTVDELQKEVEAITQDLSQSYASPYAAESSYSSFDDSIY